MIMTIVVIAIITIIILMRKSRQLGESFPSSFVFLLRACYCLVTMFPTKKLLKLRNNNFLFIFNTAVYFGPKQDTVLLVYIDRYIKQKVIYEVQVPT